jgi:membrane protein implicated in regulation of membrane protease activity
MAKITIEDIVFWIFIAAIIGIALWLLSGSPPEINAIISVALFVAASEILLWKQFFKVDKKTEVEFMKIKSDMDKGFNKINNRLESIENLIKKKK